MRKWEMILYSIGDLSKFTSKVVRYEDVIVNTFELFPKSFHLVGYPQYPDTESISKKIYDVLRVKGFVTTATVRIPLSFAASAITGIAPVPVPPPIPAVKNTISAPSIASSIRLRSSCAACFPISGFVPAPKPCVNSEPN